MSFVVDLSFGWRECTGKALADIGASGAIGYAGCNDTRKNVPASYVADWLNSGLTVGLVIENFATDAIGGAAAGEAQGSAIVNAAKTMGYAWQDCVLFGGYDSNSHAGDYSKLLAYEDGFASKVPVPGFYSDSDAIDYLHDHGSADWIFWQSDSTSFSPRNPTPNAHIIQRYNDPRAKGLPVDVNDIHRSPVPFMGVNMQLDPNDPVVKKILDTMSANQHQLNGWLALIVHGDPSHPNSQDAEAAHLAAVQAAVDKLSLGGVDTAALSAQIVSHLRVNLSTS